MLLPLILLISSAPFIYSSLLASKCEAFHGRSLFYKSTCYLIIDADSMCCTRVFPDVEAATKELTDSKLKQLKFLSEDESTYDIDGKTFLNISTQMCVLSALLQCPPGSKLVGTKCFYLYKETTETYKTAINYCESNGMQMFYPHSDDDIKSVIEFTQANNVNEIWLSIDKQDYGHYARWFDTSLLTSTSQNIYKTLSTGGNGSTPIGYMNVVVVDEDHDYRTYFHFVCASVPSIESVSTTPTTTSATFTTPIKMGKCEDGWFKSAGNSITKKPFCYKVAYHGGFFVKDWIIGLNLYETYKSYCQDIEAIPAPIFSVHDQAAVRESIEALKKIPKGRETNIQYEGTIDAGMYILKRDRYYGDVRQGYYIGLLDLPAKYDKGKLDSCVTPNCPPLDYHWDEANYTSTYTNWVWENEYNNWQLEHPDFRQECTAVSHNRDYKWATFPCVYSYWVHGMVCAREDA